MSYTPLHVHSQYTILNSSASIKALVAKAKDCCLNSLALTDFCNMYGAVDFFKTCQSNDIKPLIGSVLMVAPKSRLEKSRMPGFANGYPVLLLAKDKHGYRNLCELTSKGFLDGFYYTPRIDRELLESCSKGLICLTGLHKSYLAECLLNEKTSEVRKELSWFQKVFNEDLYFEIQRHEMSQGDIAQDGLDKEPTFYQEHLDYVNAQKKLNQQLLELSKSSSVPIVAANEVRYIDREDWSAHEVLMNIQSGEPVEIVQQDGYGSGAREKNPKRQVLPSHEFYFKSPQQMQSLFADLPNSLAATEEIASKCEFEFDFQKKFYPTFVPPDLEGSTYTAQERKEKAEKYLRDLCYKNIPARYTQKRLDKVKEKYPEKDPSVVVTDRLEYELELITSKGLCDYLLIVYDFIAWAKSQNIPVGPGRGSGAGSIILYLIGITDIEPLRFDLFFERFINPERISYPDIDVDICMERRSEVIDYTLRKYGKEKVAQIITFGTMKAKMAIKDVGRVLSVPLAKVNQIAKLIPEDPTITIERALSMDQDLLKFYQDDEEVGRVIDVAKKLEGAIRNTGIHAAGIIVSSDPLTHHIPVCTAKDTEILVTQYSMKPVEAVGMLKIDFLGLKTLTSIQRAVDAVNENHHKQIDWVNLDLDDKTTFNLLNQGKTQGIFQLESSGMQDLTRQLHVDRFEEIIAVGALYRPGPMEMIPSFISRKHGREKIEYDHEYMKDILQETYGIMVYQEQVMQIASTLANYSLGAGDLLRKAMGKKDKEEMARQRVKFGKGIIEKGIDEKIGAEIFDKIEKFASYGFNKSHATAYGFISYVTAYLKANYPKEWLAALMTCDIDDITKVSKHIRECQNMGIAILPPDVNESSISFVAVSSGIRFGLSAIKGVGRAVVEAIVEERTLRGSFNSLVDFIKRIDLKKVGKKTCELLITAGCFDFTGWSRAEGLASLDAMFDATLREKEERAKGVMDLFESADGSGQEEAFLTPAKVDVTVSKLDVLRQEKELLGFYITGHPMESFQPLLNKLKTTSIKEFSELTETKVVKTAFVLETAKVRISKTQRKFAICVGGDGADSFEFPLWPDLYEKHHHLMIENKPLLAILQVEKDGSETHHRMKWLEDLASVSDDNIDEINELCKTIEKTTKKMSKARKNQKENPTPSPEMEKQNKEKNLKLLIKLDGKKMRLSHVAKLKKVFKENPGHISVDLKFLDENESPLGSVLVHSDWGVRFDGQMESQLKKLSFVRSLQLISLEC